MTGLNIDKIAQPFPQCVTERKGKDGKIGLGTDFEKLREELSTDVIDEGEECYQFTWPDKKAYAYLANMPTTKTLRPCREESVDFDHTQPVEKACVAKKHIMDYVFPDSRSDIEFAGSLDGATGVCVYARLPRAFQISTPVGNDSPDWAIACNQGTLKYIFFMPKPKAH